MRLNLLDGTYAVCNLDRRADLPNWAGGDLVALTIDNGRTTVVCRQEQIPSDVDAERDWKCFQVEGPLEFSMIGVISRLTSALADAGIAVYVVSTYRTDYVLVKSADASESTEAFRRMGHEVKGPA